MLIKNKIKSVNDISKDMGCHKIIQLLVANKVCVHFITFHYISLHFITFLHLAFSRFYPKRLPREFYKSA